MVEPETVVYKVIVVGDPMVGKTSLLTKWATKKFKEVYLPTMGANITAQRVIIGDSLHVRMQIWDIAGQKKLKEVAKSYFGGASGIIIVYDITRKSTFNNITSWYEECINNGLFHIPIIIVGNKIDLERRKVEGDDARRIAHDLGAPYFETSAKTGEDVAAMFTMAATRAHEHNFP